MWMVISEGPCGEQGNGKGVTQTRGYGRAGSHVENWGSVHAPAPGKPSAERGPVRKPQIPRTSRLPAASAVMLNKLFLRRIEWNLPRATRFLKWPEDLKSLIFTHLLQMHVFNRYWLCQDGRTRCRASPESSSGTLFLLTPSHVRCTFHA